MAVPYKIEPDVFTRVCENILDTYARNRASLQFPRLAIIAGQPGAGKSTVTGLITESFGTAAEPVIVNFDDLRNFHPAAQEIFQRHPFEFAVYTNEDTWIWTDKMLQYVKAAKNNVLYESTLRVANPIEIIIQSFQGAGYAVDLHALAVNAKLSIQGIYERFENQLDFAKAPRWTSMEFHDACYVAFPANAEYLEAKAGLERVAVYRRDGTTLYLNTNTATPPYGSEQAIVAERARDWEPETKQKFAEKWGLIVDAIKSREGLKPNWYVENARRLRREAELFASARQARAGERLYISRIEEVTHHHVFTRSKKPSELICFDKDALDAAKVPVRNLHLVPQPQDSQPL
jgi:predicted ABC-type ATPase